MSNTDIRTLKIFEFNRALSYVSDLLENLKQRELLLDEREQLIDEKREWIEELDLLQNKSPETEIISVFISNINSKIEEISEKYNILQSYIKELNSLVNKIMEYVLQDDSLCLKEEEIQENFLEEYIYLLTEVIIKTDDDYIQIEEIFQEKGDLIMLIVKKYGDKLKNLIYDIVNADNYLDGTFMQYFDFN